MKNNKIINFFFEIASLRRLTRSHRQVIRGVSDNISDHSFRTAIIGMTLASLEDCNKDKVLKMCLFHDLAEARTGDANLINKLYLNIQEKEAGKDQMEGLPIGKDILELTKEYEKQESLEAVLAKDANLLDQMILQQEYLYSDTKNREIWQKHTEDLLKTDTAKKLAKEIKESNPFEWLYQLAEKKTDEKVDR